MGIGINQANTRVSRSHQTPVTCSLLQSPDSIQFNFDCLVFEVGNSSLFVDFPGLGGVDLWVVQAHSKF